jgi:hypothetical protein
MQFQSFIALSFNRTKLRGRHRGYCLTFSGAFKLLPRSAIAPLAPPLRDDHCVQLVCQHTNSRLIT